MRAVMYAIALMFVVGCGDKKDGGEVVDAKASDKPGAKGGIPDDWTHKELVEHLNKKGLKLRLIPTELGSFFGPSAFLVPEKSSLKDDKELSDTWREKKAPETTIYCTLRKTSQEAKDEAGVSDRKVAAGRFVFEAAPTELKRLKIALSQ